MPDEVARVGGGVGSHVERLPGADARQFAAGDVSDGVSAGFARRQPDGRQHTHYLRGVVERDVVKLDVLAGGYVSLVEGRVRGDYLAHYVELVGGHSAEGYLDSEHMDVGLSLPVNALSESERHEVGRIPISGLEPIHPIFELFYFGGEVFYDRIALCHCRGSFLNWLGGGLG